MLHPPPGGHPAPRVKIHQIKHASLNSMKASKRGYDDRRLVNRGSSDRITISPQLSFFPASSPLEVWGVNLPDSGIGLHVEAL